MCKRFSKETYLPVAVPDNPFRRNYTLSNLGFWFLCIPLLKQPCSLTEGVNTGYARCKFGCSLFEMTYRVLQLIYNTPRGANSWVRAAVSVACSIEQLALLNTRGVLSVVFFDSLCTLPSYGYVSRVLDESTLCILPALQ